MSGVVIFCGLHANFQQGCIIIKWNQEIHLCEQMRKVFKSEDLESSLQTVKDPNLKDSYPIEEVCKVSENA